MSDVGSGRVPAAPGSCPSDQAASHPAPLGFDPSRTAAPYSLDDIARLIDECRGWHQSLDGREAGDGAFTIRCENGESEQTRLNLRATLRDVATVLAGIVSAGDGWQPISSYPREKVQFGPTLDDTTEWGPEALLLMPPCGQYPHDAVAVTGHLEADMWLSRDAGEPACWGDLAAEPIAWRPLPPASGIEIPKGPGSESPAEGESPALAEGTPTHPDTTTAGRSETGLEE